MTNTINKSEIFKKAWELARTGARFYGGSVKSYFAESLRMVWNWTAGAVAKLELIGGREWIKGDHHRVYFNVDEKCELYGLINVMSRTHKPTLRGNPISKNHARKIYDAMDRMTIYYDVKTGEIIGRYVYDDDVFNDISNKIRKVLDS